MLLGVRPPMQDVPEPPREVWSEETEEKMCAEYKVICPYCGKPAEYVDSKEIYGISYGMIYLCRDCCAYVGCHRGSKRPLGQLADADTRKWRHRSHSCFDWLWRKHYFSRGGAYHWLAEKMGLDVKLTHIGMFDVEQCQKVIDVSRKYLIDKSTKK